MPGIAEGWSVSPDGATFTFKLRKGLKFPSGNAVSAEDVAWTMKRTLTLNLANAQRLREWDITAQNFDEVVKVVDPLTLTVKPTRPFAPGLFPFAFSDFRNASVLDRKAISSLDLTGSEESFEHALNRTHFIALGSKCKRRSHTASPGPPRPPRWSRAWSACAVSGVMERAAPTCPARTRKSRRENAARSESGESVMAQICGTRQFPATRSNSQYATPRGEMPV